jgi:hypothetical protein
MVPPFAEIFGIESDALSTAIKVVILFLVVIWAALIFWTYADARRRMDDPMLIACATAASLFPYVGTIVYTIVRPPEYLDDVRLRELEMHAVENRLHSSGFDLCPHCDYEVEKDFVRCPSCLRRLKEPCRSCSRPLDPAWKICPYCEAEVGATASTAARRTTRRRRTEDTAAVEAPPSP